MAVPREGLEVAGGARPHARVGPVRPLPAARARPDLRMERAARVRGRAPAEDGPDGGPSSARPVAGRRTPRAPDAPARGRDRKAPGVRTRTRRLELALPPRVPGRARGVGPRAQSIPDPRAAHPASAVSTSVTG